MWAIIIGKTGQLQWTIRHDLVEQVHSFEDGSGHLSIGWAKQRVVVCGCLPAALLLHGITTLFPSLAFSLFQAEFLVDELALITVRALFWSLFMPFLAQFRFVVSIASSWLLLQLMVSVGVWALLFELAFSSVHPVLAHFGFVVDPEVLDVLQHVLTRLELHLLLRSGGIPLSIQAIWNERHRTLA